MRIANFRLTENVFFSSLFFVTITFSVLRYAYVHTYTAPHRTRKAVSLFVSFYSLEEKYTCGCLGVVQRREAGKVEELSEKKRSIVSLFVLLCCAVTLIVVLSSWLVCLHLYQFPFFFFLFPTLLQSVIMSRGVSAPPILTCL